MTKNSFSESGLNLKNFYKELGQLLYSVAYADGTVRKQEVEALREFILKDLLPIEFSHDSSGMNHAFYTQFEFEELAEKKTPPQLVFLNFHQYLKDHAAQIDAVRKEAIVKSVEKVAAAYKGINKTEQELIDTLKTEIAKL